MCIAGYCQNVSFKYLFCTLLASSWSVPTIDIAFLVLNKPILFLANFLSLTNLYCSWLICGLMYGRAVNASTREYVQVILCECCKNNALKL